MAGKHSIRINDPWRVVFRWTDAGPEDVEIKFFKTGAAFWMNIQARFDLETAEGALAPQIKKIAPYEAA